MTTHNTEIPASARVQVVLFNTSIAMVSRQLEGLLASVAVAKGNGSLSSVELAFGDCSEDPCLTVEDQNGVLESALEYGFDSATYEHFGENLGSAGGSNRLAEGAQTDLILVLNPDTYPSPWMLHHQVQAFRPGIAAVEARQLPIEHPKEYDPVTHDVPWASGACTMFRRSVFEEVGGFDTDHFFLHCDDVDISWRIRAHGYRIVIEPTATVLHHKPIHLSGAIRAPRIEKYYGALGKLMLATRFGRTDVIEEATTWIRAKGDDAQKDAVDEYEARVARGAVPDEMPDGDGVAVFVKSDFARHRF